MRYSPAPIPLFASAVQYILDHRFIIFASLAFGERKYCSVVKNHHILQHFSPHDMASALPVVSKAKTRQNVCVSLFVIYEFN